MKKILVTLFLLSAILLLGAPFAVGLVAEHIYHRIVENSQNIADGWSVKVESYNRGWLDSTATLVATPRSRDAATAAVAIWGPSAEQGVRYVDHIMHGPISRQPLALALATGTSRLTTVATGAEPLTMSVQYHLHFDASLSGVVTVGAFRAQLPDGTEVNAGVGKVAFSAARNLAAFDYDYEIDDLSFNTSQQEILLKELAFSGQQHHGINGVWLGKAVASADEVTITGTTPQDLTISQLQLENQMRATGELVDIITDVQFMLISSHDEEVGPGSFSLGMTNLDSQVLVRIRKSVGQSANHTMLLLATEAPRLLAGNPGVAINGLSITTQDGQLTGDAELALVEADPAAILDPTLLVAASRMNTVVKLPKQLARRMEQQSSQQPTAYAFPLTEWLQQGYLVPDGKNYRMQATFDGHKLTVNGVEKPLPL